MSDATESFSSLLAAFRHWLALRGIVAGTIQGYEKSLALFFRFIEARRVLAGGRVDVAALDGELLCDYQAFLFEHVSSKTGQRLKSNTQLGRLMALSMFTRFLAATHRLATDPGAAIRRPRQTRGLPAAMLSPDEMRKLLAQPDPGTALGFRDRVILEVLWCAGLRVNELLTLAPDDVDFAQGLLTIAHGKGDKPRVVPLGQAALAWLREYIGNVRPILVRAASGPQTRRARRRAPGCERLFLSCRGQPLDVSGLLHRLKLHQRRAGLRKNVTVHSFRHTLATEMLKRGADLRHIQAMLGHERLSTTARYTHIVKRELKKVHGRTHPRELAPFAGVVYRGARA